VTPWTVAPRLLCPWGFSRQEYWNGLPRPPQGDILNPAEPPEKPKNTEMGSLSLLQGIFLTHKSSWGLLHCRRILYQLSYQGTYSDFLFLFCQF